MTNSDVLCYKCELDECDSIDSNGRGRFRFGIDYKDEGLYCAECGRNIDEEEEIRCV